MRLFGGLLLVTAFFLLGVGLASRTRTQVRQLEALSALLEALSQKLRWSREPLADVFASFRDPLLEQSGFLPTLRAGDGRSYPADWARAVKALALPPDATAALLSFGETLGRLPLQTQQERTALCKSTLDGINGKMRAREEQTRRSTVALWTLFGLLLAILLL